MRVSIHLPSALAGASVLGLVLLAIGAQKPLVYKHPVDVSIRGIPGPEDRLYVYDKDEPDLAPLESRTILAVSTSKWFVLEDEGGTGSFCQLFIVDAQGAESEVADIAQFTPNLAVPIPPGGSLVLRNTNTGNSGPGTYRISGYYVDV